MDKLRMESIDMTGQNIEKIGKLFPNVITESKDKDGKLKKAINFGLLKQLLSADVMEGDEAYDFTWVGKKASIVEANRPVRKTLRPCKEESKNWDMTGNLYIEGDNLDVLKLLQESYLGKIKMIYIDPPYNTGNDFVYRDNFTRDKDEYEDEAGIYTENGERLFHNTQTNGRFHSDWCSMIYPRLVSARNLLSDDGVIFISIDDNEASNLRKICDEVLGEANFIAQLVWERAFSPVNLKKHFSESHDYILCYAKSFDNCLCNGLKRSDTSDKRYQNPDNDPRGDWTSGDLSVGPVVKEKVYEIVTPSGRRVLPPNGYCWRLTQDRFNEFVNDNRIWFGENGDNVPRIKRFLSEVKTGITPMTIWKYSEVGHSQEAKQKLKELFDGSAYFEYPKPVSLIKRIVELYTNTNDIVMDFFSGSATTAHAVMQLNAEDGGNRKFIMVQLQENCPKESEACQAGYKNICEIGKERIRRAGEKIKTDSGILAQDLDIGFRVFKLDSSNMKDVYSPAKDYSQTQLNDLISNIKEDRTDLDLLFACLLEWGLPLSLAHKTENIDGFDVHTINDGDLMACFADEVRESVIREIAKRQPLRVVFRDSSFGTSPEKINVEEIFKLMSPKTTVKVI